MTHARAVLALAAAAALAACGEALGPGNASDEDRADILALLDESGWFADEFAVDGAVQSTSLAQVANVWFSSVGMAADTVEPVRLWGRRLGQPTSRERTVLVEGDTARVTYTVTFDGRFLLDRTADGQANPTSKPLKEQAVQHAVLVRRAAPDSAGHRWRLLGVSPREHRMTDAEKRTVAVTRLEVSVNGTARLVIEDPSALLDIETRMPRLRVGDAVRLVATVANTTGHQNVPQTFVFLHLFHASPNVQAWVRVRMDETDPGEFVREWTVRFAGRERIGVDAIDSETFNTDDGDDYRANVIGIPYRVAR